MRRHLYGCAILALAIACSENAAVAGLTAYWPFDTDYKNALGNAAYDGTPIGTGVSITSMAGEFQRGDGGLKIDNDAAGGAIDYVDVTANVLLGTPGQTVSTVVAWYRFDDISFDDSDERNFLWETAPSDFSLSFGIRTDGFDKKAQWFTELPSTGGDLATMPIVNDAQWHHVAVSIDEAASTLKFYHDGLLWEERVIANLALDRAGATGFHIGSHRASDGSRNWDGYIDELAVFNQLLTDDQIAGLFNKSLDVLDVPTSELALTINRDTGRISLTNPTDVPIPIEGISIQSAIGALDSSKWMSIAGNYDSDSGGAVDASHPWAVVTSTDFELSESGPGGMGGQIAAGAAALNLGNAWRKSPREEVVFSYTSDGQRVTSSAVQFTGNGGQPFDVGDINFDGEISSTDWVAFLAGHGSIMADMSIPESYLRGDLDGDLDNDISDFQLFRVAYEGANGMGSFAALVGVPEPSTLVAFGAAIPLLVFCRRRQAKPLALCVTICCLLLYSELHASTVAYWSFDTGFEDSLGNTTYDGIASGTGVSITNAVGEFKVGGGALKIDSSPESVGFVDVMGDVLQGIPGSIRNTVVGWYRYEDIAGDGSDTRNFIWETAPANYPLSFAIRSDTTDGLKHAQWFTQGPDTSSAANSGPIVDDGQWHHAAVVIDESPSGRSVRYYHDGQLWNEQVPLPAAYVMNLNPTEFHIGNHRAGDGARNWDGYIDEVAVFDQLLTAEQVAGLYNQTLQISDIPRLELSLAVDRATGTVSLNNQTPGPIVINSYQISSPGNSLNAASWTSLDDQNVGAVDGTDSGTDPGDSPLEGWDAGGGSGPHRLIESRLLGSTEIAAGASLNLGRAFDTTVNLADLELQYSVPGQGTFLGSIEYVSQSNGDFNGDGAVDAADYVVWRDTNGTPAAYDLWRATFGMTVGGGPRTAGAQASVPEPSTLIAILCLAVALSVGRQCVARRCFD